MTFNHEAVAALPVSTAAQKALIRAMAERRFAYCLDASESAANFIATDPATGVLPLYLIQNNISFQLDATDTTTVADGVTCLVTNDGKRYKAAAVTPPFSVLSIGTSAQPASPSVGDSYILPTAATGTDWAGKDGQIGIYTARGWVFAVAPIGRFIYVRDVTSFYHRNNSGVWTQGVGSLPLGSNSVPLRANVGVDASLIVKVENQTTNAPPASPSVGLGYIIGSSPTGAWAGNPGKLARCEQAGLFTIYSPAPGDIVYDKSSATNYQFDGTAWNATTNVVKRINASTYNVTAADNNKTLSFYGGAFQTVLFDSAGSLPVGFKVTIHNEETTPVGKGIGGTSAGSFTLYPGQSYDVAKIGSTVTLMGGLKPWVRNGVQLYVHGGNGSDDPLVADGLADSFRAYKTKQGAWNALNKNFLHCGGQSTVTLTGNFAAHHEFQGQPPGCQAFYWVGSAPGAYVETYASGGSCWTVGDGCCMLYANITFLNGGGGGAVAIQQHQKSVVDQLGGVVFGNFETGNHIGTDGAGWTYNINASYTIVSGGNASSHISATGSGVVNVTGGITVSLNGPTSPYFPGGFYALSGPVQVSLGGGITFGVANTGTRQWNVGPGAWLSRSGNTIPGNVAGLPTAGTAPSAGSGWVT
ncbi:DUF2793 domain-containing protein [Bradyrhizobium sp. HKCCYLS3077]|uniref:DUF2793 domain-containing protein n=1 Tax=Bradyrhizobium sp. HKCCYLS3077 TaxID=3420761 RepID=UPI003EC0E847